MPPSARAKFLGAFLKAVEACCTKWECAKAVRSFPAVVERIFSTARYRLCMDIDVQLTSGQFVAGWQLRDINDRLSFCVVIASAYAHAMARLSSAPKVTAVMLTASELVKADGLIKCGVHVVFPDFIVDQATALALYGFATANMKAQLLGRTDISDGDVQLVCGMLDHAPLKNGGIRLPFAAKHAADAPCEDCDDACKKQYLHAYSKGGMALPKVKCSIGRPYTVYAVEDASNPHKGQNVVWPIHRALQRGTYDAAATDAFIDDPRSVLSSCTLVQPAGTPLTPLRDDLVDLKKFAPKPAAGKKRKAVLVLAQGAKDDDDGGGIPDDLVLDAAHHKQLQDALLALPAMEAYRDTNAQLGTVTLRAVLGVDCVRDAFIALESMLCPRDGKDHKNNHAYMRVRGHYGTLRCHDEECTKFESAPFLVPVVAETTLFGDAVPHTVVVPSTTPIDDVLAAREFARMQGDNLVLDGGKVWLFDERGLYTDSDADLKRVASNAGGRLVFAAEDKPSQRVSYGGSVRKTADMLAKLPDVLPRQDGFFKSRIDSDVGKFLFADGIYDYENAMFTKGFDRGIVFRAACPHKFPAVRVDADVAFVRKTSFEEPFLGVTAVDGTVTYPDGKRLLHNTTLGVFAGHWRRKMFCIVAGPHDSSKGAYTQLTETSVGSDMMRPFAAENLFERTVAASDPSLNMKWLIGVEKARVIISNEADLNGSISGVSIKKLVSGGDASAAVRDLYVKVADAREIVMKAMPFLMVNSNSIPTFTNLDNNVASKLELVTCHYSFVGTVEDPSCQKPRIPNLKEVKYHTREMAAALFWLTVDYFKEWVDGGRHELPRDEAFLASLKKAVVSNKADLKTVILGGYSYTGTQSDWVTNTVLADYAQENGVSGARGAIMRKVAALHDELNEDQAWFKAARIPKQGNERVTEGLVLRASDTSA